MTTDDRAVPIRMPDLSPTENEVTLVRWHVRVGEKVALGQPLLEVETAKAVMDVESVAAGVVTELLAEPGDAVEVGTRIAVIAAAPRPGMATAPPPVPATDGLAAPHSTSRPAPRGREARQAARVAPPATAADTALPRQSFFARNRARRAGSATATAIIPAPAVTPATATSIGAYTLTASAIAARLPGGDMAMLADVIAAAALRAMAAALGLTGTGVAVIGPDGDTHAAGNSAKIAMLLAVVEGESIESFRAAGGMPVLAAAPPGLAVTAAGPGSLAIEPRLPLALTADGSAIAPSHAARFLDSLVKELESL